MRRVFFANLAQGRKAPSAGSSRGVAGESGHSARGDHGSPGDHPIFAGELAVPTADEVMSGMTKPQRYGCF